MSPAPEHLHARRFAEALRPAVMGPRLAAALGDAAGACHVLDAKYEPGVRAVLLYDLGGRLLRGDLLAGDEDGVPTGGPPGGPPSLVDPGVLLSPFPHDPDLLSLPEVMDPTRIGPVLAGALRGAVDPALARRARVDLLRYRPGKRATVLVTAGGGRGYVVKAYHNPAKAAAVADEAGRLRDGAGAGALAFAPPAGHVPELALVVQHRVQGTALDALLGARGAAVTATEEGLARAGRALAQLHGLAPVSARQRPVERELVRFTERAGRIAAVDPGVGRAAAELAARLSALHDHLPPGRPGVVHGDCKPSQFLLSRDVVHLLDLDHCGVADQCTDVGTFLATLRQQAVRHGLAGRPAGVVAAYRAGAGPFLRAYARHGGDLPWLRVQWHEAVALERKALRAFARAPRSPLALALITEAQRCLDTMEEAA